MGGAAIGVGLAPGAGLWSEHLWPVSTLEPQPMAGWRRPRTGLLWVRLGVPAPAKGAQSWASFPVGTGNADQETKTEAGLNQLVNRTGLLGAGNRLHEMPRLS